MTLRPFLAVIAVLAAPAALMTGVASAQPGAETTTSTSTPPRTGQAPRKIERIRPGTPLKPRVIEAPGAALMMIPASYDPSQSGPLGRF